MRLWLPPEQADFLLRHTAQEMPYEACGVLAGIGDKVIEVIPLKNSSANPRHHYHLDDHAYTQALFRLQKSGLSLLAFYHSHPESEAVPSPEDIRQSAYPDTPYLIVSLRNRQPSLAAWSIRYSQVTPVELYLGLQSPPAELPPLTQVQKAAIILSAIIAIMFMLILSLSLLPPAPVIIRPVP